MMFTQLLPGPKDGDTPAPDHSRLLMSVEHLAQILFRTIQLAAFQHAQIVRLSQLLPPEHAGEAKLMIAGSDERGEAVAAEFAEWAGPGLDALLNELLKGAAAAIAGGPGADAGFDGAGRGGRPGVSAGETGDDGHRVAEASAGETRDHGRLC